MLGGMRSAARLVCVAVGLVAADATRSQTSPPSGTLRQGVRERLLLVAPRRFQKAVNEYAAFKKERRPVEVAVLEDVIAKSTGVDDPERLKHFLYDAWKGRGV